MLIGLVNYTILIGLLLIGLLLIGLLIIGLYLLIALQFDATVQTYDLFVASLVFSMPTNDLFATSYIAAAVLTFDPFGSAFIVGGRWKYMWLGTIVHGVTTELVSFFAPDIDNYWHSQTSIILLGRRLPLHIPLICNYMSLLLNAPCAIFGHFTYVVDVPICEQVLARYKRLTLEFLFPYYIRSITTTELTSEYSNCI